VCVCQIHENLRYALKSLTKSSPIFANLHADYKMHQNFVCSESQIACFENTCVECQNSKKLKRLAEDADDVSRSVSWFKWVKTGDSSETVNQFCNIEKVQKTGTILELLAEIYDQAGVFLLHEFIKINQSRACERLIGISSATDSDSSVICCDFAEKFKCLQQNSTQSAFYGQTPVSLFTVAVYHRGMESIVLASDFEKNTKDCVLAYLDQILELLPATVKNVEIFSDNATSQFKNQYVMEGLKNFEIRYPRLKIRWSFYAAMHGKSVVDGIGGSVKRFVRRQILTKDLLVNSAGCFTAVASSMKIKVNDHHE
jgi:hypothetical protein